MLHVTLRGGPGSERCRRRRLRASGLWLETVSAPWARPLRGERAPWALRANDGFPWSFILTRADLIVRRHNRAACASPSRRQRCAATAKKGSPEGPRRGDRDGEEPRRGDRDGEGPRRGDRDGEGPRRGNRDGEGPRRGNRDGEGPRRGDRDGEGPRRGEPRRGGRREGSIRAVRPAPPAPARDPRQSPYGYSGHRGPCRGGLSSPTA